MEEDAAVDAEVSRSTFTHRMAGRRSGEDYGKTPRLLIAEEVSILMWGCVVLKRPGWSQAPEDLWILAFEIVQKRDAGA